MQVALYASSERLALAIALGLAVMVAGLCRWRRAPVPWTVGAISVAVTAGAALLIEQLVVAVVSSSAPVDADFNDYRWVLLSPWGRLGLALGIAAAAVTVVLSYVAARRLSSPWRRAAIVGLRAAAAGCALVLFLEPAVELRQVAREPNRIAILVDESRSMSLEDGDDITRQQRARRLLDASSGTLEAWRRDHIVDLYAFADGLTASSEEAVATAEPTGPGTLLRQALEQLRARYDGDELAGVVVLSDGVVTGDFARSGAGEQRDFVRSLDTPVHTVWVGRPGLRDVSIARVRADEFAFVRTVTRVEAVVRATGYGARRIPVTLASDGQPLRRKWVELGAGEDEATVFFEFTPPQVGKYVYEISTPIADDEAVRENNARRFVVRVIRDKIRVLQVAGQPSWDVRALRGMLEQNPNVDLISFFILRTHEDMSQAPNSELSLIPFPTQELFENELPSFDLVVLQNFEFGPYGIGQYLENIRAYVEGGGGLMMLGGPLGFASGRYTGTPVADALPVDLPSPMAPPETLLDTDDFQVQLTDVGAVHPVTALRYESADNRALWKQLPPLEGVNVVRGARPGAAVLATHPTLRTPGGAPMPVISAWDYGDGRSLAVTTDSLWRWGFVAAGQPEGDGRHYLELWDNAIRWLIQDPELRYLRVESDRVDYEPGAAVRLDVRLLDQDYTPLADAEVALEISRGFDPKALEPVGAAELVTSDTGEAVHELSDLEPGVYRVRARSEVRGREVDASDIFLVRAASAELDQPAADPDRLAAIAEASGGRHLADASQLPGDLRFIEPQIVRVDRRSDVELWSRPSLLVLALLFLGLEWGLRQRSGSL